MNYKRVALVISQVKGVPKHCELREATRNKKQLDFGFLLKGGGVQTESKVFEELFKEPFFSLSLEIFFKKGAGESNPNLMRNLFS